MSASTVLAAGPLRSGAAPGRARVLSSYLGLWDPTPRSDADRAARERLRTAQREHRAGRALLDILAAVPGAPEVTS
ncbi:hypothetical protein ACFZDG_35620 [Kitasatospora xanthocidica]|uniref:hypothetical protein n=1 Tax=Kitasatospora xanthocidica TaxID=83382 RepID=UPI0036E0A9CF